MQNVATKKAARRKVRRLFRFPPLFPSLDSLLLVALARCRRPVVPPVGQPLLAAALQFIPTPSSDGPDRKSHRAANRSRSCSVACSRCALTSNHQAPPLSHSLPKILRARCASAVTPEFFSIYVRKNSHGPGRTHTAVPIPIFRAERRLVLLRRHLAAHLQITSLRGGFHKSRFRIESAPIRNRT